MSLIASPYLDAGYGYGYGAPFGSVMGLRRGGTVLGRPHRVRKSRNVLVPPALPVAAPLLGTVAATSLCAPAIVETHCAPAVTTMHYDSFVGSSAWI